MPAITYKIFLNAAAGGLGGSCAWFFIMLASTGMETGLISEMLLGGLAGFFIGGMVLSHETITGRRFRAAWSRAVRGGAAGLIGGMAGALFGNTAFTSSGRIVTELGGFTASAGVVLASAMGWAVLGASIGASGGLMIRSIERARYGVIGGSIGGFIGGLGLGAVQGTGIWSALSGLFLLGSSIGGFISMVEEAYVSAKVRVIKGRHIGREFPLLKESNVVGRDDRSDICLSGAEGVGMRHAVIMKKNGRYSIERTGEGTGLYVNHKKTEHSTLSDGDIVRVGSVLLIFNAVRKAAAAAIAAFYLLFGIWLVSSAHAEAPSSVKITQFDLAEFPDVKAFVSVLDRTGRPVQGLHGEAFRLEENNVRMDIDVRPAVSSVRREPLSLSLVIDRSGSMSGEKIARAKESVLRFVSFMEQGDRAAVLAFSDEAEERIGLTSSQEKLRESIISLRARGHTALYDAVARGVDSVKSIKGRRAVIVLTDGIANKGTLNIDRAIEHAVKNHVSVYAIGLGEDARHARLERLAAETGGSYFFAPAPDRLEGIYGTIGERIRDEYIIRYKTAQRGEYLRNVVVSARGLASGRAYFQPDASLFGAGAGLPGWAFIVPLLAIGGFVGISLRDIERRYAAGHLSVVRGKASKKEIDITSDVSIGRDERNVIGLFQDEGVEQRHAEVVRRGSGYLLRDLSDKAGVLVNDERTKEYILKDGDVISIGGCKIVFSEGSNIACPGCGTGLRPAARFCPRCGAKAR